MARDTLTYASGNSASTTLSSSVSNSDTAMPLTSDTNFAAQSGEGMVIIDEGTASEELAYATTKAGASLTTPLANRGLESTSAAAHDAGATVKGILSAGMWNDLIDSMSNVLSKTDGTLDTTKVVDLTTAQTLTNKSLTSPTVTASGTDNGITVTNAGTGDGIFIDQNGAGRAIEIDSQSASTEGIYLSQNITTDNKAWINCFDDSKTQFAAVYTDKVTSNAMFRLGTSRIWVDSTGDLRIKTGSNPANDTDGDLVGTQS